MPPRILKASTPLNAIYDAQSVEIDKLLVLLNPQQNETPSDRLPTPDVLPATDNSIVILQFTDSESVKKFVALLNQKGIKGNTIAAVNNKYQIEFSKSDAAKLKVNFDIIAKPITLGLQTTYFNVTVIPVPNLSGGGCVDGYVNYNPQKNEFELPAKFNTNGCQTEREAFSKTYNWAQHRNGAKVILRQVKDQSGKTEIGVAPGSLQIFSEVQGEAQKHKDTSATSSVNQHQIDNQLSNDSKSALAACNDSYAVLSLVRSFKDIKNHAMWAALKNEMCNQIETTPADKRQDLIDKYRAALRLHYYGEKGSWSHRLLNRNDDETNSYYRISSMDNKRPETPAHRGKLSNARTNTKR